MDVIRRQAMSMLFQLFDLALMTVSFIVAALIALHGRDSSASPVELLSLSVKISNFLIFAVMLVAWHMIFEFLGLHDSKRLASRSSEVSDLSKATLLSTAVVAGAAIVFHIRMVDAGFLANFFLLCTGSAVVSRLALRHSLASIRRRGRNRRAMLIVGTNQRALEFTAKIENKSELAYDIIGFSDDRPCLPEKFRRTGHRLVCDLTSLPDFLRSNVVDEVILALPMRSLHAHASKIAAACEEQGIVLRLLCSLFDLKQARPRAEEFEGNYVITHDRGGRSDGWGLVLKRVMDIVLSVMLLTVLAPVLVVIAIAIKLTSTGPVFFLQERLGRNKRRFRIWKFRTMVMDAEKLMHDVESLNEVSGPVFKMRNDPRVTRLGRFLRKTSLDELPQLFNVIKGDMSLVGPRPLAVRDYELMAQTCPDWQCYRFSVTPGITCLWQVNGRNEIPFDQWMELDREYIKNWSLWLDFQIMFRTVPAVLKRTGV